MTASVTEPTFTDAEVRLRDRMLHQHALTVPFSAGRYRWPDGCTLTIEGGMSTTMVYKPSQRHEPSTEAPLDMALVLSVEARALLRDLLEVATFQPDDRRRSRHDYTARGKVFTSDAFPAADNVTRGAWNELADMAGLDE